MFTFMIALSLQQREWISIFSLHKPSFPAFVKKNNRFTASCLYIWPDLATATCNFSLEFTACQHPCNFQPNLNYWQSKMYPKYDSQSNFQIPSNKFSPQMPLFKAEGNQKMNYGHLYGKKVLTKLLIYCKCGIRQ